jgi:predicted nucleotidyltransferase
MFDYNQFLTNCDALVEDAVKVSENLMKLDKYGNITKNIRNAMWQDYQKKVDVYVYGSRACGLATKSSDLDIFVDIDDNGGNFFFNIS